ncbi:MAG: hypothetical protein WCP21_09330, partial [Armatimonadota bacterium]
MNPTIRPLPDLAPTVASMLGLPAPSSASGAAIAEVVVSIPAAERVAVLVPDALGRHPLALWAEEMPFLSGLHERRTMTLRSIMPSITPVNFAGIVSGADLSIHGIQRFTDGFRCETLFEVVRAHGG